MLIVQIIKGCSLCDYGLLYMKGDRSQLKAFGNFGVLKKAEKLHRDSNRLYLNILSL